MPPRRTAGESSASSPKLLDTVRLSADGLAKVLGDLEARLMREVWTLGRPATAREIHARLIRSHRVSPLTTITVLNRLAQKRILRRTNQDDLLHYEARMSEAEFMTHASRRVVAGILSFGPDAVAASFVDVLAERDPEQLDELARLIRQKRRARDNGK